MCKGMTVDCIDCIETCAAAKTVVEEANDRSLFDVPQLKAHFTTTFIEVILIFTKKHNFKEIFRSTIWSIQMFPKRGVFAKRRSRKRSKERKKRSEKNVEKTKKSVQMAKRWGASGNRNTIENRALNKVAKTLNCSFYLQ